MLIKEVSLAASVAAVSNLVLGKISFKPLQQWLQQYHTSLPAAVNGALYASVGVVAACLLMGQRIPYKLVLSCAGGAASAQMALGGDIFRKVLVYMPYDWIAPAYTALGVALGYGFYKLLM